MIRVRAIILLCIVFVPLAIVQARSRSVSLAIGDTLTVTCPGRLAGTIGAQQADLACGAIPTPMPAPTPTPSGPGAWLDTFDGMPASPQPFAPVDWANTVHSRDRSSWQLLPTMHAGHGTDCAAPPTTHEISAYADSVFTCHDHVMTAIDGSAGYAAIYLQPPVMVDFAQEAVIRFDVSTARTTSRDWIDLWITPFDEQLAAPLQDWLPDLQGEPKRAVHVAMDTFSGKTTFRVSTVRDFVATDVGSAWWLTYEDVLIPSATVRTPFELRLSQTHVWFGIPGLMTWIDADSAPLDWSRGVVQIGHHSYTPFKDCAPGPSCGPNTWHWDNVSISRAVPYHSTRVSAGLLDATTPSASLPTGASGHLRFLGYGDGLEVSFDDGATWQPARRQAQEKNDPGAFATYWQPIPAGAQRVTLRSLASCWCGDWAARDLYVIGE